jgi:hypothetical protein
MVPKVPNDIYKNHGTERGVFKKHALNPIKAIEGH